MFLILDVKLTLKQEETRFINCYKILGLDIILLLKEQEISIYLDFVSCLYSRS